MVPPPSTDPASILETAAERVRGTRRDQYGPPGDNAVRVAAFWETYLAHRPDGRAAPVTPADVCVMMILLKIAREVNAPKRDSRVDIAGWAAVLEEVTPE